MTAIAGHIFPNGGTARKQDLQQNLLAKVGTRGEISQYSGGGVLMLHAYSGTGQKTHTLDEPRHPILISGDIRIDNRDDLMDALGPAEHKEDSDAALVRRAFMRWGPECFGRLIGDFAIAIWDTRDKSLYCCRDHFGVRPMFYQTSPDAFTFATEAKMLPAFKENTFSDIYLASFVANIPYCDTQTAHPGIQRLMPGNWLRWQDRQVTVNRYWELEIEPVDCADPTEEFRALFSRAVRDRMTEPSKLATLLSGGLDSSAITGVAEKIRAKQGGDAPLKTYSMVYHENPLIDERRYINDLLAGGAYQPKQLPMDHYQPLKGMNNLLRVQEGPFNAPGLMKTSLMYQGAAQDGVKVILDGHGGDEVVGYGTGRLWELAVAGKWLALIPVSRTHSRLFSDSPIILYQQLLERFGSEHYHTRAARWFLRHFIRTFFPQNHQPIFAWEPYVSPAFAKEMDLQDRSRESLVLTPEQRTSDQHYQRKGLVSPSIGSAFETFDKLSAVTGLEIRYPFFDIRLVQFCLGLASSEKLRRNETRSILRRAMKDIYPSSIAKRQDKTNFIPELAVGLVRHHGDILTQMARDPQGRLAHYFDMDKMRTGLEELKRDPLKMDGGDVMFFWRAAVLHLWFEKGMSGASPVEGG
tara:strand:+ start:52578 stop:54491 length:1914 start_codon:yes stop_codon:yes gene_type:complete